MWRICRVSSLLFQFQKNLTINLPEITSVRFVSQDSGNSTSISNDDILTSCALSKPALLSTQKSAQFSNDLIPKTPDLHTSNALIPKAPDSHTSQSFMNDPLAQKFINCMMFDGKKSLSQKIFRKALESIKMTQLSRRQTTSEDVETDPLAVFHGAFQNVMPVMGTRGVRKGGRLYQVPVPLHPNRRRFLAIKWLITAARERSGPRRSNRMPDRLAAELLDAFNNQGSAIKRKQDLNRLTEANRAFAHFRW